MAETETHREQVEALAALIGGRNFISFEEIRNTLGLTLGDLIFLKPDLEVFLSQEPGGLYRTTVTSCMHTNPPGLLID